MLDFETWSGKRTAWAILLVWILVTPVGAGCGATAGSDSAVDAANVDATPNTDSEPADAAAPAIPIPDPGGGPANWVAPPESHGTPGTAHAVGVVTSDPGYLEGTLSAETGLGFYVFRTGPSYTSFTVNLAETGPTGADLDFVHVHEGAGLVLGAEVVPDVANALGGTWTLTPDTVYVLVVGSMAGGFF